MKRRLNTWLLLAAILIQVRKKKQHSTSCFSTFWSAVRVTLWNKVGARELLGTYRQKGGRKSWKTLLVRDYVGHPDADTLLLSKHTQQHPSLFCIKKNVSSRLSPFSRQKEKRPWCVTIWISVPPPIANQVTVFPNGLHDKERDGFKNGFGYDRTHSAHFTAVRISWSKNQLKRRKKK